MSDLTEKQSRQMKSGSALDSICARFMGYTEDCEYHSPPTFSKHWSYAGPLLEAMSADLKANYTIGGQWECIVPGLQFELQVTASTPQLAIARACAILAARGITREEIE